MQFMTFALLLKACRVNRTRCDSPCYTIFSLRTNLYLFFFFRWTIISFFRPDKFFFLWKKNEKFAKFNIFKIFYKQTSKQTKIFNN